jgi:hypothetical protein
MSTIHTHECQSRPRRKYATQPHCPQDAQREVAVSVTQWALQTNFRPWAVASINHFRHVVQTYTWPMYSSKRNAHCGIDNLPGAALRCAPRPPQYTNAHAAQTTDTHRAHHKAGMMIITRGLLLFFVLLPAASCLKFRLTILKKM